MDKKLDLKVPVMFQKLNSYEVGDTRFIPVKIWLMHLGSNLNGSYFEKEVVTKAIPSLANTPILAYVEEDRKGEEDFSDHRIIVERKNGDIKLKYIGKSIGVIPETNEAKFEFRLCDDGIEREFLTCIGLVWTKWTDSTEILNRDLIKNQSMELDENFYEGSFQDDGYFHFSALRFFGACALGDSVQPAMVNSTIEVNFSNENMMLEINKKLEEFKNYTLSKSINPSYEVDNIPKIEKGGTDVEEIKDVIIEETIETPVEEVVVETVIPEEEPVVEVVIPEEEVVVEDEPEVVVAPDYAFQLTDLQSKFELLTQEFETYKSNYSTSNEEATELLTYKTTKLEAERKLAEDSILDSYENRIGNTTEFSELKVNKHNFTLDSLEKECIYIVGLHTEFAKETKTEKPLKFSVEKETETDKESYGGLFKKHLNK